MTLEQALKMIREICESVNMTKKQHDTVQVALKIIETNGKDSIPQ